MFLLLISFLSDNWQVFIRSTRAKISLTVSCAEKCSVRWRSNNHNIRSTFWYDSSSSIVSPFPVCVSFFPFIQQHFQFTLSRHRDTLLLILKSNGSEKTTAHSLYHPSSFCHVFVRLFFCIEEALVAALSFWNISHSKNIWWKRRGSDWYHFVHPFPCFKIIILCKMLFMMMIRLFFLPLSIHHVKNAMARWICDLSWFDCFFFCLFALSYVFFLFLSFFSFLFSFFSPLQCPQTSNVTLEI